MYVYPCEQDLRAVKPPSNQLGGKDPSTIIDANELITEVERIAGAISSTETPSANLRQVDRALTALKELRKLVGADRVRSKWVREQHAHYTELDKQLVEAHRAADGNARIVTGPYVPVTIDREARRAHVAWLKRGRSGPGRIEAVDALIVAERFSAEDVTAGRFERTRFGEDVSYTTFDEAELVECTVERACVASAHFARATLTRCSFDRVHGQFADFSHAQIDGCSFDDAVVTEALWSDVIATSTSFAGTCFAAGCWERATFRRCSFHGASFEPRRSYTHERMVGARFEDCDFRDACFSNADLRGATFVRCQFAGAHGVPRATDGLVATDCDVTDDELRRQLPRVYTVDEIVALASSVVVAADRAAPKGAPLAVFARERTNVRRIGIVQASGTELTARGIPSAVTYGTCGFVWAADGTSFRIWCREQASIEVTRDALVRVGHSTPTTAITAVLSVDEPERSTRRGVVVRTPSASPHRLMLVQDEDAGAMHLTATDRERGRQWTRQLARELAAWLCVQYIDGGEPSDGWT